MFETMDKITKQRIKVFSCFTGALIIVALILSGITILARKNSTKFLPYAIKDVLENSRPLEFSEKYRIGSSVKINSASDVSSALFEIVDQKNKVCNYVLITRVTTYYGPQAAVFLYNNDDITFEGFACLKDRTSQLFINKDSDLIIKHWKLNAEKIFKTTFKSGSALNLTGENDG